MSKQRAFDVFLAGKEIDTVFATDYSAEEMRKSLIDHDGYDPGIVVYRRSIKGAHPTYDQVAPLPTSKV
jgi:hypothetical protein